MKPKTALVALPLLALSLAPVSGATKDSDRVIDLPISSPMNDKNLTSILPAGIKYYFADQSTGGGKELGELMTSHRKSPVIYLGPAKSCDRAFISGLVALGESAKAQ